MFHYVLKHWLKKKEDFGFLLFHMEQSEFTWGNEDL